jgi:hypothetical protein
MISTTEVGSTTNTIMARYGSLFLSTFSLARHFLPSFKG